jgi:hypothetical protein
VLGAFFAPLLLASPPPAFVAQRAAIRGFAGARARAAAPVAALSWFSASDTHFGHDPKMQNGTVITSYTKNGALPRILCYYIPLVSSPDLPPPPPLFSLSVGH